VSNVCVRDLADRRAWDDGSFVSGFWGVTMGFGARAAAALVLFALSVAGAVVGPVADTSSPASAMSATSALQTVEYHGYRFRVPSSWPVIDLDEDPTACVRLDRHAVYLGEPGDVQDCPARLLGRVATVMVEPAAPTRAGDVLTSVVATAGSLPVLDSTASTTHQQRLEIPGADVLVTTTWADADRSVVESILRSGELLADAAAPLASSAPSGSSPRAGLRADAQAAPQASAQATPVPSTNLQHVTGGGFDACKLPSDPATMAGIKNRTGWVAAGFYLGGVNASCPQADFGPSWVKAVAQQGWTLIPIWVGLQFGHCGPPTSFQCAAAGDGNQAYQQGVNEASAAVTVARSVGLGPTSPIYLDIEAYARNATIDASMQSFTRGWTLQLHALGYRSGYYSSAEYGIDVLSKAAQKGASGLPDNLWIARWNCSASTSDTVLPSSLWVGHRIHQYGTGNPPCSGLPEIGFEYDADYVDAETSGSGLRAFIEALFTDFLGRAPTESEIAAYVGAAQHYSRTDLALQLARQPAWVAHIVADLYQRTLHRNPDAAGLNYWTSQISSGRMSVAQVAANFYGSQEYYLGAGGSDIKTWVTDLYRQILGRAPDNDGLWFWAVTAVRNGRVAVAYDFYQSTESALDRVSSLYHTLLGRSPDAVGQRAWVPAVKLFGDLALAATLAGSTEYYARAQLRF
jgi:hypothetical protein